MGGWVYLDGTGREAGGRGGRAKEEGGGSGASSFSSSSSALLAAGGRVTAGVGALLGVGGWVGGLI